MWLTKCKLIIWLLTEKSCWLSSSALVLRPGALERYLGPVTLWTISENLRGEAQEWGDPMCSPISMKSPPTKNQPHLPHHNTTTTGSNHFKYWEFPETSNYLINFSAWSFLFIFGNITSASKIVPTSLIIKAVVLCVPLPVPQAQSL